MSRIIRRLSARIIWQTVFWLRKKGCNDYVRLPETDCAAAKAFWNEEKAAFWSDVRYTWEAIMKKADYIHLKRKVNGRRLYEALDDLEAAQTKSREKDRWKVIRRLLDQYITIPDGV